MSKSDTVAAQDKDVRAQYLQHFNPRIYHDTYYLGYDEDLMFFLRCYHDAFNNDPRLTRRSPSQRRVLELGCGPVPIYAASAAGYASSITMCEFLPQNRAEIKSWMEAKEEALDWSVFFTYLASLDPHRSVGEIEGQLRSTFKEIIPCDLEMDNPLADAAHSSSYDVVMTNLCLEFVALTKDSYNLLVGRLASLLRPGGVLIMSGALGNSWYLLGDRSYPSVPLKEEDLRAILHSHCLEEVTIETLGRNDPQDKPADHNGIFFLLAQRRREGVHEEGESKGEDGV